MIIGNGLLAKGFKNYSDISDIIIFASGVSNSKESRESQYQREKELLTHTIEANPSKTFVYFSTCSVYDHTINNSKYVLHKKDMESLIMTKCNQFYIFRLPQVVGKSTSPTLVNYLFKSIQESTPMNIYRYSTRNLIFIDDVFHIADEIITKKIHINEIINIASLNSIPVMQIVQYIEKLLDKKAHYTLVDEGERVDINIDKIKSLNCSQKVLQKEYTYEVLSKYMELMNA
jgi:nucleoside-diphosphate-sugar epimerase